jgi:hypothetical protein
MSQAKRDKTMETPTLQTSAPVSTPVATIPTSAPAKKKSSTKRKRGDWLEDTISKDEALERAAAIRDALDPAEDLQDFVVNGEEYESDEEASEKENEVPDDLSGMSIDLSNLPPKRIRKQTVRFKHEFEDMMNAKYEKMRQQRLAKAKADEAAAMEVEAGADEEDEDEVEAGEEEEAPKPKKGEDDDEDEDEVEEPDGDDCEEEPFEDDEEEESDYVPSDKEDEDEAEGDDEEEEQPKAKAGRKRKMVIE